MPDIVDLKFIGHRGPRADERHFATHDVPKLRELVKTGLPQDAPDGCNARIFGDFVKRLLGVVSRRRLSIAGDELLDVLTMNLRVGIRIHGAKLQAFETSAELPQPLLLQESRALGRELYD